jgi:hypothetical protein
MCLLANTSNDKPAHSSKSLICLPMKTRGIILDKKIDKVTLNNMFHVWSFSIFFKYQIAPSMSEIAICEQMNETEWDDGQD